MKKPENSIDPFNQRGAVMVETALVLPVFLALLLCCLDLPRLVVVKQRLAGASRFAVEGKALGLSLSSPTKLQTYFFDDMPTVKIRTVSFQTKGSSVNWLCNQTPLSWLMDLADPAKYTVNWPFPLNKIMAILGGVAIFPEVIRYLSNPINGDVFYGTRCKSDTSFLLAPAAYRLWVDYDRDRAYVPALHETYMPNRNSYKDQSRSFVAKTGDAIGDMIISPIKSVIDGIVNVFKKLKFW